MPRTSFHRWVPTPLKPYIGARLRAEPLEDRITPYSQAVHQWITQQGYDHFAGQFGKTAMADFVARAVQGSFDEDEAGANPFGHDSAADHPSFRHFWGHDSNFNRTFNDGLAAFESAPNRSIMYVTGGKGLDGGVDDDWGEGQAAVVGEGAAALFATDAGKAFHFIGHAAHLLQDMTLPAHVHNDDHVDFGSLQDPDPYHDWVDGKVFSTADGAGFNAAAGARQTQYALPADADGATLRSAYDLPGGFTPGTDAPSVRALYNLYLGVASMADDFDSKDVAGQVDREGRNDESFFDTSDYDNWTQAEVHEIAQSMVPLAIRSSAELYRYFFGIVDDKAPTIDLPRLRSTDPARPQVMSAAAIRLEAAGTDVDTGNGGVGKGLFEFKYAPVVNGAMGAWVALDKSSEPGATFTNGANFGPGFAGKAGASAVNVLPGEDGKVYAVQVSGEDAAGNRGDSKVYYVRVGKPAVAEVTVIDRSGSMYGGKLTAAIASATQAIGLRADFDRIGVVAFSSAASVLYPLTVIAPGSGVRAAAQATVAGLSADGSTSIGSGLLAALGLLGTAPDPDFDGQYDIVVLTDGEENESPYIAEVIGQIPGYVRVHGIAFGSGADAGAIQDLARGRNGQFFAAADPADLPGIYARVSGATNDAQDVFRTTGTIQPGADLSYAFTVDASARDLNVGVLWPGSDLDLTLTAPDGTTYSRSQLGGGRFSGDGTTEFLTLPSPQTGRWTARVTAVDVDPAGEPFELYARVASPLTAEILTATQTLDAGTELPLALRLTNGAPVLGASVRALLIPAGAGPTVPVPLFDDGTHGDAAAGDGVYSNTTVVGALGAGVYTLQFEAVGPGFVRAPSQTLLVTGTAPANTAPTVSAIANLSSTGEAVGPVNFTVGDAETATDSLVLVAASSDSGVVPVSGIRFGGTGAARTVTVTPAGPGTTTVTVTVTDAGGRTATETFTVTVAAPNAAPTISAIADPAAGVRTLFFTVDDDAGAGALSLGYTTSDPGIVPAVGGVSFFGDGRSRSLQIVPVAGARGTVTITVTATDAGGRTAARSFAYTAAGQRAAAQFAAGADAGGSTVAFYDPDGAEIFAGEPFGTFAGGVRTAAADFTGDGVADLVVGTGPGRATEVVIYDGVTGDFLFSVEPFEASFTGGVYVAAGDVNGDGLADLIVTPDEGGGPRVDAYSGAGFGKFASFFGIDDPNFRGGARASTGDVNGDGTADLIVVAGFGGGPRVAGFDGKSIGGAPVKVFADFFAFEQTLRDGIFIAAGDLDGDGYAELICGGGPGGGPRVTAFGGKALLSDTYDVKANFFGGDTASRGGIRVAVKNLDDDARADIVVGAGAGAGSRVTGYYGKDIAVAGTPPTAFDFDAFEGNSAGVFVG